ITFTAYNDENAVWTSDLSSIVSLLGLDLLELISLGGNHSAIAITTNQNVSFNRVQISFSPGLIDLNVLGDIFRVYNIKLAPAAPTIIDQPIDHEICEGENVTFTAVATSPNGSITGYQWQYHNGINWVNASGDSGSASYTISNTPLSFNGRLYRVAVTGGQPGCEQTVYSGSGELRVAPLPGKPHLTISDVI